MSCTQTPPSALTPAVKRRPVAGAVPVGAADILRALSHAGLPHGQFGFGGEHFGKRFELGEDDELRVLVRAVADGHAVRE